MVYRHCSLFLLFLLPICCAAQDTVRQLKAVDVRDRKSGDFRSMNQVEGMKLTAGKKTELINVEQLTVNKSTNNARQVYAKVAGLNIFENDGSGLQLSIGGRGLDPNRTSNFNVRQNGYDISADALGYPESYYTPPTEALKKIEVIKGAASLQYGTQFGGLLNFEMKQPDDWTKPMVVESKQTIGSWGYFGSYNSIGGTKGKLSYFAYLQYKRGDGWRPNSGFEAVNAYADMHYHINEKHMLGLELTHLNYLSQQPGGLTDQMFAQDPRQSNRQRNWFKVDWNLADLEWDFHISDRTRWQTRASGLLASRDALGYRPNRPNQPDQGGQRDLLNGVFKNGTLESRLIHRYNFGEQQNVLLTGIRAYYGHSTAKQGYVDNGSGPNFTFSPEAADIMSDYVFPNLNLAAFAEHIIRFSSRFNITPGVRAEYIRTQTDGYYHLRETSLSGTTIYDTIIKEKRELPRSFVLAGIGSGYKLDENTEFYGNISQNYRSVTFSDIRTMNPSFEINPDIKDEKGWSADLGARGNVNGVLRYDANVFFLYYGNRIGEYFYKNANLQAIRRRDNVGVANIYGLESYIELNTLKLFGGYSGEKWKLNIYSNLALTKGKYTKSPYSNVVGKSIEYVPFINLKTGVQSMYKNLKLTIQFSALSYQFADATNEKNSPYNTNVATSASTSGVNGLIPAYQVADISAAYTWRRFTIEGTVNNVLNAAYFTRRATGYPGPGIIPGDGRGFFLTLGIKI